MNNESKIVADIVVPYGMFGAEKDYLIDSVIRAIAEHHRNYDGAWAEKYGSHVDNDIIMMHPYCWCEMEDCKWCSGEAPNFYYKPFDFKVTWYKYIGRVMQYNKDLTAMQCAEMLIECLKLPNTNES